MKTEAPRYFSNCELRVEQTGDGKPKIIGYAAVFNARSKDLGGFVEEIAPGAFTDALAADGEVLALVDHDPGKVLGRRSAGTLRMAQDEKGLRVEIDPPDTSVGRDAVENIRRKDIKGMSFRFPRGAKDSWRMDGVDTVRTVHKAGLRDVTVTAVPAYDDTTASLRTAADTDDELRGYYAGKIAEIQPKPAPVTTPKRNIAEKRMRLLAGEVRCGCDGYPVVAEVVKPDPAVAVSWALYAARQAVDAAREAMDALADAGDDVDANLVRTCVDTANQADATAKRMKELSAACRAVKVPEVAPAAPEGTDAGM